MWTLCGMWGKMTKGSGWGLGGVWRLLENDIGNVELSNRRMGGMEKNVCTSCVILMEDGWRTQTSCVVLLFY
jgi:hypothetical protein